MDHRNYQNPDHPWDDSVYGTGPMEPPKSRNGLIAFLLILIIFLCGIVTILGILNVQMFRKLNHQQEESLSIAVMEESLPDELSAIPAEETIPMAEAPQEQSTLNLQEALSSPENIPQTGGMSLQDVYQQNIPAVVSITCSMESGGSTGTGVVFSEKGYIVTNAHVVDNTDSITVQLSDNRIFSADLVGSDTISDLAVLYIRADNLTAAQFGNSDTLRVGDTVVAIGDPLGVKFRGTMTDGIVSAINRDMTVQGRTMTLIQTNAALNSGNSGGPLINIYGQVVGINTMKIGAFSDYAGVEGLGFAIPSTIVKDVVEQIIHQGYVSGRPTLGIEGEALDTFYQYYYRLPAGLYITQIESGSPAHRSGIEPGDILLTVDDTRITDMTTLNSAIFRHEVGDTVTVTIHRGGQRYSVDLQLAEDKG